MEIESGNIYQSINTIARKRGNYSSEAYFFTLDALNHTVHYLPVRRHLSGQELLRGIVLLAWERFGDMAINVLDGWGIGDTIDFGVIVQDLVEEGILSKTDEDSLEDFENVFDLQEAITEESWRQRWRVGGVDHFTGLMGGSGL